PTSPIYPLSLHDALPIFDMRKAFFLGRAYIAFGQLCHVHGQDLLETHAQAHDLESPGVGISRAIPVFKGCNATCFIHDIVAWLQDRKSTRLNSSHVSISY